MDWSGLIICAIFFAIVIAYGKLFPLKEKKDYAVSVVSALKTQAKDHPTGAAVLRMKFPDTLAETGNETEEVAFVGGDSLLVYRRGQLVNRINKTNLGVHPKTYAALAVDLDDNGLDDLIVAREDGVFAYMQKAEGEFDPIQIMPAAKNSIPIALAISDLDRNGEPDLHVSNFVHPRDVTGKKFGPTESKIMSRNPDGGWEDITEKVKVNSPSYTAAFVDLDNDGWPDLVMVKPGGVLEVYKNNAGVFSKKSGQKISDLDNHGFFGKWNAIDENSDGNIDLTIETRTSNIVLRNDGKFSFTEIISPDKPNEKSFENPRTIKPEMDFGKPATPGSIGAKKANAIQTNNKKLASKGHNEDQLFSNTSGEGGLNSRNIELFKSQKAETIPIVNDNKSSNNEFLFDNKSLRKTSDKSFMSIAHSTMQENEISHTQTYLNNFEDLKIGATPRNPTSRYGIERMKDKPTNEELTLGKLPEYVTMDVGSPLTSMSMGKKDGRPDIVFINMLHSPIMYLNSGKFNEPEIRKYLAAANGYREYQHNVEEFLNVSIPSNAMFFNSTIRVYYTPKNGTTKFQERQSIRGNQTSGYVYHFILGTKADDVRLNKVEIIKQNGEILSYTRPVKNSTLIIKQPYS